MKKILKKKTAQKEKNLEENSKKKSSKEKTQEKVIDRKKQGRTSRQKGANFERDLAKKFEKKFGVEFKRTPQSGGFAKRSVVSNEFRGDIVSINPNVTFHLSIEAKNQKNWKLKDWLEQAEDDAPKDKKPIVIFHQHNSSRNYVCLSLEDFFDLLDVSKVIDVKGE